jgi:hypothetical protein
VTFRAGFLPGIGVHPEQRAIVEAHRKARGEKVVLDLLDDDQKKTWKEMTGEPFEVRQ